MASLRHIYCLQLYLFQIFVSSYHTSQSMWITSFNLLSFHYSLSCPVHLSSVYVKCSYHFPLYNQLTDSTPYFKHHALYFHLPPNPVSYTHLDVYKRQCCCCLKTAVFLMSNALWVDILLCCNLQQPSAPVYVFFTNCSPSTNCQNVAVKLGIDNFTIGMNSWSTIPRMSKKMMIMLFVMLLICCLLYTSRCV